MVKQAIALGLITASLLAALVYSQQRSTDLCVSGFIEADEIRVGSRVGGRVRYVYVAEGQTVQAGDVLLELEPYQLNEQLAEAKARLTRARAEANRLRAGLRAEEIAQARARYDRLAAVLARLRAGPRAEDVEAARLQVALAETQLELARQKHERFRRLLPQQAASREELELAVAEFKVARATVDARTEEWTKLKRGTRAEDIAEAEASLEEARQAWLQCRNGSRPEDIEQAEAAVEAAAAAVACIARQLDELTIKAPSAGIVEAVELHPGDLVGANQPVLSLMDATRLRVRAYVPENRLVVPVGAAVTVTVDSYPGERFPATVTFIARQAEFTPGNVQTPEERSQQVFRIKAMLDGGHERLRPGMAADVWLCP